MFGRRYFIFEDDGTLRHVPQRVLNGLTSGTDRIPELAGKSVRFLSVYLELRNRRPVRISGHEASVFHFDQKGEVRQNLVHSASALADLLPQKRNTQAPDGSVVDISAKLKRQRYERENRWTPTDADITRVVNAIWPKQAGKPIAAPEPIKGSQRRRLPVSYEVEHAVRQLATKLWEVERLFEGFSDKDLKAFIQETEKAVIPGEPISNELWKGVAAAVSKTLEVRQSWRSKKGRWIAYVDRVIYEPEPSKIGTGKRLESKICDGRDAAVTAARELLAKYANQFEHDAEILVHVKPEIEWDADELDGFDEKP